jgi:ankyrin repeat protein
MAPRSALHAACAALFVTAHAPASAAVDFARDIQPLFEKHCYECHGPKKQQNGFRVDRRSRAMAGVLRPAIIPGDSAASRLYRRIFDGTAGQQMPPEEVLSDQEIETVRSWIDEGAHWPDHLANEFDAPPPDPAALRLIKRLRVVRTDGQAATAIREAVARNPAVINARGPAGATPLMYAALYADVELLRDLLAAGGNPNIANDSGGTALMWAVEDRDKVALLLDAGANPNATSGFGRTALSLAAIAPDSTATAELLLARGAKPSPMALGWAAASNHETVRRLLAAGAKDKGESRGSALRARCYECLEALQAQAMPLPRALLAVAPPAAAGYPDAVRKAIESGADVNARDPKKRTPLIMLAISEYVTPDVMQSLIDRGVDVHAKSVQGLNALDYALRLGRQPVIEVLSRAGLQPSPDTTPAPRFVVHNTVRAAVTRALPLLQSSGQKFYAGGGCVACHHNLQGAVTVTQARRAGVPVNESLAHAELSTLARDIDATREQALQGMVAPGGVSTTTGYILLALEQQAYPPDEATDALARLLRLYQRADGRWMTPIRPPIEASEFTATAVSARGLRFYGVDNPATTAAAVARARRWLETAAPLDHEDRVFRLLGLVWLDSSRSLRRQAARQLLETQRRDGGWAQTEYRASDAYATGEALYALRAAGVRTDSRAYRRGVRYLLQTQLDDGSWWVRSRALPTQTHFESGFPHGEDQFISAAATHWATQALLLSLPDAKPAGGGKVAAR